MLIEVNESEVVGTTAVFVCLRIYPDPFLMRPESTLVINLPRLTLRLARGSDWELQNSYSVEKLSAAGQSQRTRSVGAPQSLAGSLTARQNETEVNIELRTDCMDEHLAGASTYRQDTRGLEK